MSWRDYAFVASLVIAAWNAWGNKSIQLAIATLRGEIVERIAKAEGQIEVLRASAGAREKK